MHFARHVYNPVYYVCIGYGWFFLTILPTTVVCFYRNDAYFLLCSGGVPLGALRPNEKGAIVRALFKRAFGAEAHVLAPYAP